MSAKRKLLLGAGCVALSLFVSAACYLALSDLSRWRDTVARLASGSMNRTLTIAGDFTMDIGFVTRIRASDVGLANTDWGSEPEMAHLDRVEVEIALWPLVSGSIHLPSVDVDGGRAIFEFDDLFGSNWAFGGSDQPGASGPVRLRIDRIRAREIDLVLRWVGERPDLDLAIESLDSTGDTTGRHRLSAGGSLNGTAIAVTGRLGPLQGLVNLTAVDHDLDLSYGTAQLHSAGSIADLRALSGLDLETSASVPDPSPITRLLGLPDTELGPLTATVTASAAAGPTSLKLTADDGAAELRAEGTVDSLVAPGDLDLALRLSGPDIRSVAALAGISGLAGEPFEVVGRFRWRGFPIQVSGLEARVGDNTISADGRLGAPPLFLDTDFALSGSGPNLAAITSIAGLAMPREAFEIEGRLFRVENGLRIERLNAAVGPSRLTMNGFVGDPPEYADTELSVEAEGPRLSDLNDFAGVELPDEDFEVEGRLGDGGDAIALDGLRARVGRTMLTLDGRVTTVAGMNGTDVRVSAEGPALSVLTSASGIEHLPDAPFRIAGGVGIEPDGYRLSNLEGRIGNTEFALDGELTKAPRFAGSRLRVEVDAEDLSVLGSLAGVAALPAARFRAVGDIELSGDRYGLRDVELELGSAVGRLDGAIGAAPQLVGTDLEFSARGPSLAVVNPGVVDLALPDAEFTAAGRLRSTDEGFHLESVEATVADNRVRVARGLIVPTIGFAGSALEIELGGSDLGAAAVMVSQATGRPTPDLPPLPYSVIGGLATGPNGYSFDSVTASLGDASGSISGRLGRWPELTGTDLEVAIDGADASIIGTLVGMTLAPESYHAAGRLEVTESGYTFERVALRLGDNRIELDGSLGRPPGFVDTDLDVDAGGSDLSVFRTATGLAWLPARSFEFTGRFEGDPERFTVDDLDIRVGSSDLTGDVLVNLEGRPALHARLHSGRLALDDLRRRNEVSPASAEEPQQKQEPGRDRAIPDAPLDASMLTGVDAELDWDVDELQTSFYSYHDVGVTLNLDDSALTVNRLQGVGAAGGTLSGFGSLTPAAQGLDAHVTLQLAGLNLNLAGPDAADGRHCLTDGALELSSSGGSWRELAAAANGHLALTVGPGDVAKSVLDKITADVLVTLFSALNPFDDKRASSELQCAVFYGEVAAGVVTLDPMAVQTDTVTMLGDGTVDLTTEKIAIDWVTKPRKGIGLSASTVTNSYIRLGGTLAHPAVEMKPLEALATTGVAVATMGVSFVAKGLFDRVTAEKKVCQKAMREIEARNRDPDDR